MSDVLQSPEIENLSVLVEEVARSSQEGVKRFIEPAAGTLGRATSRRHHIVFGRRGSGKTSLLRKAASSLIDKRQPIAFVDLERFTELSYPDVVLSVLIETFTNFKQGIEETPDPLSPPSKSLWEKFRGSSPSGSSPNGEAEELKNKITEIIDELKELLHRTDDAEVKKTQTTTRGKNVQAEVGGEISIPKTARVSSGITKDDRTSIGEELQESFRRSKVDFLRRNVSKYGELFNSLAEYSKSDAFLFLDDLYYIRREDQPQLLGYFHRVAKGNNLWIKVGTIRHRSRWYIHSDPPIGLKLGDDAADIDLDLTLEKYTLAKDFLIKILTGLVNECSAPSLNTFLTDKSKDRLVLASGGVARDFLEIFRRSINQARERLQQDPKHRRPRIGVEDINQAAGEYVELKMEDFKRDAFDDQEELESAFRKVGDFCINRSSSCFLLDQDASGAEIDLIDELVDLRLVHFVRSRVTISGKRGDVYKAYMLDVSQYTAGRKRRKLEIVPFWRKGKRERLRRNLLIYNPSTYTPSDDKTDEPEEDQSLAKKDEKYVQPPLL